MINFASIKKPKLARAYMCSILIATDFLSIFLTFAIVTVFWNWIKQDITFSQYVILIPFIFLFIIAYAMMDLYPGIGQSPVTEFRSLVISTTLIFLLLAALSFVVVHMHVYSRAVFLISWILCLVSIPFGRRTTIRLLSHHGMWGEPVVMIGMNASTMDLVEQLQKNPEYGFSPSVVLDFLQKQNHDHRMNGIPILHVPAAFRIQDLGDHGELQTAIVLSSVEDQPLIDEFLREGQFHFSRIVMIPEKQLGSLWVTPFDIAGVLGFEIRQNLLSSTHRLFKRVLDMLLVILASPFILLGGLFIALAIKLDSRGPVFYRETRIGHQGIPFKVWKFRTMVQDANQQLEQYLRENPEMAVEWQQTRKLKNDPRITRVGKVLRRFSLDEFPQLINVFNNEMSLVGPRPIVEDEISRYDERFELYKRVKPGLSGLWQISGRNDLTYEMRVDLDEYYVRNYSIWMDIYIIRQTFGALISNRGAY